MTDDHVRRSRAALIALISGVVLVVVVALIAVFARGGPALLDPATPEGVVQRYSQAVVDGDVSEALSYLAPDVADSCERIPLGTEDRRLTLLESSEREDTARVRVLVVTVYGSGPLGAGEYESEEVFELVRLDGDWAIDMAPWQLAVCVAGGGA
ncbi:MULTISPECIES: hypothetical protein [unclassified Microbacterium]|uniref:hypothetical protein n=1 Tax=unclassified Microbacterium TaxID=2609290 RepID=UPI00214D09F4|nr:MULTISPECIES: hypothetical protein [unclassified Microbacterium]MCR2811365.1 hypothetical protein [Microbacterium sp. zg.B185]WIM18360.1 hypothetical protein QNO12_12215 [Microbacterium sp. zg-B185]